MGRMSASCPVSFGRNWFRWLARVIVILPALAVFASTFLVNIIVLGSLPENWYWGETLFFTVPLLVVAIIAWLAPLAGGIIAVAWGVLWLFLGLLVAGDIDEVFVMAVFGTLVLGGVLCTLSGLARRKH